MKQNYIDCHTHTNLSPDGENTPSEMCEKAIELGLSVYAITDHCECSTWFDEKYYRDRDIPKSKDPFVVYDYKSRFYSAIECMQKLRIQYGDKLNLICGVELGQPTQGYEGAEEVAENSNLDFIIGSLHQIRNHDDFAFLRYDNKDKADIRNLLSAYYEEMLEMVNRGKFDVLGHLTYPLRYIEGEAGISIDMKPHEEKVREIFKLIISKGKGIEINTSGLFQQYGKTFPTIEYVKLYREMGGEILSIGSDAHNTSSLGRGVEQGLELAETAGFKYITYFKERKPIFLKII